MRITTVRIIFQIVIIALFLTFVFTTTYTHLDQMPTLKFWLSKFLEIDPLVSMATALSTHTVYKGLIWSLVLLAWGVARQKRWAWWGSLVYMSLLALSTILTFARTDYLDILSQMYFAPAEMKALGGLPVEGYHLAAFFGVPLLVTVGLIVYARQHFGAEKRQV